MRELITTALKNHGIPGAISEVEQLTTSWHGDLHFKIQVTGEKYSARFISATRVFNCIPPRVLSDEILQEQLEIAELFQQNNIPFMPLVKSSTGAQFSHIKWEGVEYRFLLFGWQEGYQVEYSDEQVAYQVGQLLRRLHTLTTGCVPTKLLEINGKNDYFARWQEISNLKVPQPAAEELRKYQEIAAEQIHQAFTQQTNLIPIHGDLNFPNLFWDEKYTTITGVIDFDSIGISERINELAWVVKWYSRSAGIAKDQFSLPLARSVFRGYDAYNVLTSEELERFPAFIWLHSCLNNNFVKHLLKSSENNNVLPILQKYNERGNMLLNISRRLIKND